MTIIMTLLVRDEIDTVAANIEYHLDAGVDFVIATDNRSTDGTVDVLETYARAGVLHLIHEPADDYAQGRWVTRMARLAAERGADWIINNDADEFWWPASGSLRTVLDTVPQDVLAVEVERANFIARPDDDQPFWNRMTVRQRPSTPHPGMDWPTLGPKVCHRAHPAVTVAQGNHGIAVDGEPVRPVADDRLEILHFPVRSRAHFENKIVLGGGAYARNQELPEEVGKIWRDWHRLHGEGRFDAAYGRCVVPESDVRSQLETGELINDDRLAVRLGDLAGRPLVPHALDAPPTRPKGSLFSRLRGVRRRQVN